MREVTYLIPGLYCPSLPNLRGHWSRGHKAKLAAKSATYLHTLAHARHLRGVLPLEITVTRIGPRRLDPDNAAASLKGAIDGIALALEVDDGDERLEWTFRQARPPEGAGYQYAVQVAIAPARMPVDAPAEGRTGAGGTRTPKARGRGRPGRLPRGRA